MGAGLGAGGPPAGGPMGVAPNLGNPSFPTTAPPGSFSNPPGQGLVSGNQPLVPDNDAEVFSVPLNMYTSKDQDSRDLKQKLMNPSEEDEEPPATKY